MTYPTHRRFPRTTAEAFRTQGDTGFSGPYRRRGERPWVTKLAFVAGLVMWAAIGAMLAWRG
jgi:hypothetical protein